MAGETPILQDGYSSYAGGVNAAAQNYRELAEDQLSLMVNATVRGGWVKSRDGFRHVPLRFKNAADEKVFQSGTFQGEAYYSIGEAAFCLYAIGGYLFRVDPFTGWVASYKVGHSRKLFSANADFVWLQERDGYVVARDGVNRPVIIEGTSARRSDVEADEVPGGTLMADGWGRLLSVNNARDRITFSDHELDPASKSTKFTEGKTYYLAASYFQPPRRIGRIMATEFIPFVDAPAGMGPAIVFGERGTVTYDVSVPRVDGGWVKTNIERLTLLNIGACGHRTTLAVDNDLIFRDQYGRLRTLAQTVRDQEAKKNQQRVRRFDREVSPWLKRESPHLRRWHDAAAFDDRYLFTALPESVSLIPLRKDVAFRGLLAFNLEVLANLRGESEPAWEGLWTGPRPQCMTAGLFDSAPALIVLSRDSDGQRRLYRHVEGQTYDLADDGRKAIEWQIGSRWFGFKAPFQTKRLTGAFLRLSEIKGRVKIEAFARTGEGDFQPWFTHSDGTADCLEFVADDCGDCSLRWSLAKTVDPLILPKLPDRLAAFNRIQFLFRITGACQFEDFLLEAAPDDSPKQTNVSSASKDLTALTFTPWNDLSYDIVSAPAES